MKKLFLIVLSFSIKHNVKWARYATCRSVSMTRARGACRSVTVSLRAAGARHPKPPRRGRAPTRRTTAAERPAYAMGATRAAGAALSARPASRTMRGRPWLPRRAVAGVRGGRRLPLASRWRSSENSKDCEHQGHFPFDKKGEDRT